MVEPGPPEPSAVAPQTSGYTGRFAPSPTGPLHLGSLVSALGSWADAKHHNGKWIVRVEDIDPARESPEATQQILASLKAHHLHWDDDVTYQHSHSDRYDRALDSLRHQNRLYACTCTRKNLRTLERSDYPGICRSLQHEELDRALRLLVDPETIEFSDLVCGAFSENVAETVGDFIIRRRGPLYAYQLAVVVDDAKQSISHVVRGADLLDNTARQIVLQRQLGLPTPVYLHLPLTLDAQGRKLSKQTGAKALDNHRTADNLRLAWTLLGQTPPPKSANTCETILDHCQNAWNRKTIPPSCI